MYVLNKNKCKKMLIIVPLFIYKDEKLKFSFDIKTIFGGGLTSRFELFIIFYQID